MNVRKEKARRAGGRELFSNVLYINYVVQLSHRFSSFMSEDTDLVLKVYEIESVIILLQRRGDIRKVQDAFGMLRFSLDFLPIYLAP